MGCTFRDTRISIFFCVSGGVFCSSGWGSYALGGPSGPMPSFGVPKGKEEHQGPLDSSKDQTEKKMDQSQQLPKS